MTNSRTVLLRRRHGGRIARLQERMRKLRDTLHVALGYCPKIVRDSAAPLLKGSRAPVQETPTPKEYAENDAERTLALYRKFFPNSLDVVLASKGFFARVAWAFKYVFCGIGGAE